MSADSPTGWGIPPEQPYEEPATAELQLPPMPRGERPAGQGFKNLFKRFGYEDAAVEIEPGETVQLMKGRRFRSDVFPDPQAERALPGIDALLAKNGHGSLDVLRELHGFTDHTSPCPSCFTYTGDHSPLCDARRRGQFAAGGIVPISERVQPAEPEGFEHYEPLPKHSSPFADLITEMNPIMQFIRAEQERQAEIIEALCLQMLYGNGGVHLGVIVHQPEVIALDVFADGTGTTWKAWLTEYTEPGTVTYIPGWMSVDAWTDQFRRT